LWLFCSLVIISRIRQPAVVASMASPGLVASELCSLCRWLDAGGACDTSTHTIVYLHVLVAGRTSTSRCTASAILPRPFSHIFDEWKGSGSRDASCPSSASGECHMGYDARRCPSLILVNRYLGGKLATTTPTLHLSPQVALYRGFTRPPSCNSLPSSSPALAPSPSPRRRRGWAATRSESRKTTRCPATTRYTSAATQPTTS
jgi:hypothetical protein